jgi:predicted peroxiredoxin
MRYLIALLAVVIMCGLFGCQDQQASSRAEGTAAAVRDGVFIHISHGQDDVHRVLMGLQMAVLMMDTHNVLVYFDIKGIEVVLKDAEDIQFKQFPSAQTQLQKLIDTGITVMACPGCLKAFDKTPEDLREGVQVANKDTFFDFTEGRILTIDY